MFGKMKAKKYGNRKEQTEKKWTKDKNRYRLTKSGKREFIYYKSHVPSLWQSYHW